MQVVGLTGSQARNCGRLWVRAAGNVKRERGSAREYAQKEEREKACSLGAKEKAEICTAGDADVEREAPVHWHKVGVLRYIWVRGVVRVIPTTPAQQSQVLAHCTLASVRHKTPFWLGRGRAVAGGQEKGTEEPLHYV